VSLALFISYSGIFGGAERILIDCASSLPSESCLACPEGPLAQRARARGLRVFPLRGRSLNLRATARDRLLAPQRLAGHALEVRSLVRDLDPDLVVAWGMRSAIACVSGTRCASRIAFQHNDLLPGRMIAALVRAVAARVGVVIVLSHTIADDLDPGRVMRARLHVVHPGVEVDNGTIDAGPAQPPELLVLGALVRWKRPDLALEICALARRHAPELRVRFVGSPIDPEDPTTVRLRRRAGDPDLAGAVEFAGFRDDPQPALARATCLLHCAPREPFGLVVLEALAAGRPAIVPDAGGPREIVDESCGSLYPPGDVAAAARSVLDIVADPQRAAAMGSAGRRRARAQFDPARSRASFAAAIRPLVRTSSAPPLGPEALALITVTHNSERELEALLDSVDRHLPGTRVVVVDCASRDGSVAVARGRDQDQDRDRDRDRVVSIALSENVGFGRACNRGLEAVAEPVAVFVNPDVELLDDSLGSLAAEALRADRPDRLLAPLVLSPGGARQDSVHPAPGSAAELLAAVIPPALAPGPAGVALAPWKASAPRRVGWAVGCAVGARTDLLRRLGPFDESIFLYGEDLELGLRAAQDGVETWFWPQARVLHHRAQSSSRAFGGEPFERLAQARHDVVGRRLGRRRRTVDDAAQAVTFASRWTLKRALGRPAERERRQLAALGRVRSAAASSVLGPSSD
jgi:GT2 family glycosyltransferase/glycosyltransferase involved in cell wall biosynthesis